MKLCLETRDGDGEGDGGGGTSLSLAYALIEIAIHIIFFSCSSDTYFCIWHHNIAGAIVALLPDFVEPVLGLTE